MLIYGVQPGYAFVHEHAYLKRWIRLKFGRDGRRINLTLTWNSKYFSWCSYEIQSFSFSFKEAVPFRKVQIQPVKKIITHPPNTTFKKYQFESNIN